MKTTAKFTVAHGSLYTHHHQSMKRFAQLIPADMVQHDRQCWTDLIVFLDVTQDMGINAPGWPKQKTQISASFTLQLRDIAGRKTDALRGFVEHIRRDLFTKVGEFARDTVEEAAPLMPPEPEPEPVYIGTKLRVDGQKICFVSTGNPDKDIRISRRLADAIEVINMVINRDK